VSSPTTSSGESDVTLSSTSVPTSTTNSSTTSTLSSVRGHPSPPPLPPLPPSWRATTPSSFYRHPAYSTYPPPPPPPPPPHAPGSPSTYGIASSWEGYTDPYAAYAASYATAAYNSTSFQFFFIITHVSYLLAFTLFLFHLRLLFVIQLQIRDMLIICTLLQISLIRTVTLILDMIVHTLHHRTCPHPLQQ
jgi:hypothetical protein